MESCVHDVVSLDDGPLIMVKGGCIYRLGRGVYGVVMSGCNGCSG